MPGMVAQRGDGCIGPELMEETCSTGPTSRRRPARARGRLTYLFRGSRRPLSRGATQGPYRSGWHSVTELTLALLHIPIQCQGWPHREGWRNSAGM
jgi:hypothetical protein